MIVPRGIATFPYFPKRKFPTTMSMSTTTKTTSTKNARMLHKRHSANYTPHTPSPPARRQTIVPRVITTYQSLPDRRFLTTTNKTIMTTNKRRKLHKGNSAHSRFSHREADDSYQRDYDQQIHSQKVIPNGYDHGENDDE